MMKKIFAALLAVVCLLSCTITANAATNLYEQNGSVEVSLHSYSNYTITIPESFDGTYCSVVLDDAEIEEGYCVEISATNLASNGCLEVAHTGDTSIVEYISLNGNSYCESWSVSTEYPVLCCFRSGDYDADGHAELGFTGMPVGEKWKPGDYAGILCYRVTCTYKPNI